MNILLTERFDRCYLLRSGTFLAVVLTTLLSGSVRAAQSTAVEGPQSPGRVRQAVESAKAKSVKDISLVPTTGLRTGVDDLDSAVDTSSILIVQPIKKVVSTDFPDHIMTWYKLKLLAVLVKQKVLGDEVIDPPSALLPLQSDELLLLTPGGVASIDGVTVHEHYVVSAQLGLNKPYLMFLDLKEKGHVATLVAGHEGVYAVDSDDTLRALAPSDRGLAKDLNDRFANSLAFVRSYVKDLAR